MVTGAEDRHELLITHNFVIGWFVRHTLDAQVWRWIGLNQANCAARLSSPPVAPAHSMVCPPTS